MNELHLNEEVTGMTECEMIQYLITGEQAIAVSLASSESLPAISRQARKDVLYQLFYAKLSDLVGKGLEVDFTSISTSGQCVDAKLSLSSITPWLLNKFKEKRLSVYTDRSLLVVKAPFGERFIRASGWDK